MLKQPRGNDVKLSTFSTNGATYMQSKLCNTSTNKLCNLYIPVHINCITSTFLHSHEYSLSVNFEAR